MKECQHIRPVLEQPRADVLARMIVGEQRRQVLISATNRPTTASNPSSGVFLLLRRVSICLRQSSHLSRTRFPQCKRGIGILVARAEVGFHQEVGVDDWDRNVVVDPE